VFGGEIFFEMVDKMNTALRNQTPSACSRDFQQPMNSSLIPSITFPLHQKIRGR